MLSENEGDGELGGKVMELIKLGPLSILHQVEWEVNNYHVKRKKCAEFVDSGKVNR